MADLLSCVKKTSTYGTCWSLLSTLQLYYLTGLTENVVYTNMISLQSYAASPSPKVHVKYSKMGC